MTGIDNLSSSKNELRARDVFFILCRSFLVAAAIFVLCILAFPPCYGSIDDVHLTTIVSGVGVCQRPDCHILFPHIWLGQMLSWLYAAHSRVPWYGLLLSLANVFSYSLVLSAFAWERPSALRKALVGIFTLVSMVALWDSLTFTSTAIFLGAAFTMVAMSALENTNLARSGKVLALILSAAAMCFAGLIRVDSARLMLLLFSVFLCCRFAFSRGAAKLLIGLAFSALLLAVVQVNDYVDHSFYAREPGWSDFFCFNESINEICDFRRLACRSDTKKYFDSVGWNENDLNVMMAYEFAIDPKFYLAYQELFQIYWGKKVYQKAEGLLKKATEDNPDNDKLYKLLSQTYEEQGKTDLAEEFKQKSNKLKLGKYYPLTIRNYNEIADKILSRRIILIAMQYPLRSVEPLKKILETKQGIIIVDNEEIFQEVLKTKQYEEYFKDNFAGDFGHCTYKGNRLIAENLTESILKYVSKKWDNALFRREK